MMKILRSKKGSFYISTVVILFVLIMLTCAIYEYARLQIIAQGVRNAVQSAVTEICEENYANIYNGVREGYSGGFAVSNGHWSENVSAGDIYNLLDKKLKTHVEGDCHVKYTGDTVEFRISNLMAQMTNAPFAPTGTAGGQQLTCLTQISLEVPLSFGWKNLPPMKVDLSITSGYTPKF